MLHIALKAAFSCKIMVHKFKSLLDVNDKGATEMWGKKVFHNQNQHFGAQIKKKEKKNKKYVGCR